jgi:protein-tyrosine phosphatase
MLECVNIPLPSGRDPGGPYRVCLVCLGNICRSPMAEVVLRSCLASAGLESSVTVDSAGTGDWHIGQPMNSGARAALTRHGYDGSSHRARQFAVSWFGSRDLVLAMDGCNLADLRRLDAASSGRVFLFGDVGGGGSVPDPYGGSPEDFDRVLSQLERAAAVVVPRLAQVLSPRSA